jgi:hypothetical protein
VKRSVVAAAMVAVAAVLLHANTTVNTSNEEDLANALFGNQSTWGTVPAPPANNFAYPGSIGMGARALGMGEAFVGLADDVSATWWNPSGLVQTEKNEIQWMGGDRINDELYTGFFAANYMLQNRMNFALSYDRPYHPTGAIPDVIAGTYSGGTNFPAPSAPLVTVPGVQGYKVSYFDLDDTTLQAYLKDLYRKYINPAFQEDTMVFTFATPLTPDNNLAMGINVKYFFNDGDYSADNQLLDNVSGYGVDLGFMYRYQLQTWGRQLSIGVDLTDIAGQVRFAGTGSDSSSSGREVSLPTIATMGLAWESAEFFEHSELNLTTDLTYINDSEFDENQDYRVNLGGEMWFFKHRLAPRAGYEVYFNRQLSRPTVGISFRTADKPEKNGLGLDYAYMFPAENDDTAMNWFSVSFRWGGLVKTPVLPEVSVTLDPPIFAPKRGETATFTLSAASPNGIDRWTLSVIDRNNQVVKTYQDRGDVPAQIVWGGEDRQYRPLPDGEYTFLLTATDHSGSSSSTAVQTLKIYTPREAPVHHEEIDKLRSLINDQDSRDEAKDQEVRSASLKELQNVLNKKASNQDLPAIAKAPAEPAPVTPYAEAKAAAGSFDYPRVNDVPFPKSEMVTGDDGKRVFQVRFASQADQPRQILKDMADVVRVAASDVGESVARYEVHATYGNREFRIVAPASAAISLTRGLISREQFIENSAVTLDGSPLSPSYR